MPQVTLSKDAVNKSIFYFEVSWRPETGFATYNKKYARPVVPDPVNTSSGVTIGMGYDCGQYSASKIKTDWSGVLPKDMVDMLAGTAGLKKQAAVNALPRLKNVVVPVEAALQVFYNITLFDFAKKALKIYPDLPKLHPVEQSVIVSIVYNRGDDLSNTDRRKEMRQLIAAIKNDNDAVIADVIKSMCRLWPNTLGLRLRRQTEAELVLLPDNPLPQSDLIVLNV